MVAFLSESLGYQAYLAHHTRPENTPVSRPEAGVYRIFPGEVFCRLPVEPNGPICPYTLPIFPPISRLLMNGHPYTVLGAGLAPGSNKKF
ncbi:hypothetical protein GGR50DRAFT_534243 [Xylaria sp. CBS 124048]|nr:hypothetical protein GGR50DRAFT_534243 [Xylaria sp. CBS 124048]